MSRDLDELLRDTSVSPSRPIDPAAIRARSARRTARTRIASAATGVLVLAVGALVWPQPVARPTIAPVAPPTTGAPDATTELGEGTDGDAVELPDAIPPVDDEVEATDPASEAVTEPEPPAASPPPPASATPAPTVRDPAADEGEASIDHGVLLWGRWFRASHLQDDGTTRPVAGDRPLYVGFRREEHGDAVVWMASCNTYGGDVAVGAERLGVSGIGSSQVGCEPVLEEQDDWLAAFFAAGPRWRLDGDELRLRTELGGIDLVADPEGPGPPWS